MNSAGEGVGGGGYKCDSGKWILIPLFEYLVVSRDVNGRSIFFRTIVEFDTVSARTSALTPETRVHWGET